MEIQELNDINWAADLKLFIVEDVCVTISLFSPGKYLIVVKYGKYTHLTDK